MESFLEPDESILRMRTPVHEVPDTEQAVAAWVESNLGKGAFKRPEAAVNVPDNEIAAAPVHVDRANVRHRPDPTLTMISRFAQTADTMFMG